MAPSAGLARVEGLTPTSIRTFVLSPFRHQFYPVAKSARFVNLPSVLMGPSNLMGIAENGEYCFDDLD
jgi:hypothetical protein